MLAEITQPALGLVTNVVYDYLKKRLSNNLIPNFEKIYQETINEFSKKHPGAKNYLKRFFKSSIVKNLALDSKLPRKDKLQSIISIGEQLKKPSEQKIEVKKAVNDFYTLLKEKIRLNPHLWAKIEEEYQSKIVELIIESHQKIELLGEEFSKNTQKIVEEVKTAKKEILKQIEEQAEFKYIKRKAPFPLLICATQFKVERVPLKDIKNNINSFPYTSKEDMQLVLDEENKVTWQYLPKKENNVIKLTHKGMPYKIIYPPFNKIEIWAEQKTTADYLTVTVFSSEKKQITRLKNILFGDFINTKVKEINFKGKMKEITKRLLTDLTVFDYDPLIYKPVEIKGIKIVEMARRTIMFGDKGFLRRPELQDVVKKVKMEREKQITDIFFVKAENSTKLSEDPITLEIHYTGNLTGFFPRNKFTENQAKMVLCSFFEKHGNSE